jgi:hypothetical protein
MCKKQKGLGEEEIVEEIEEIEDPNKPKIINQDTDKDIVSLSIIFLF